MNMTKQEKRVVQAVFGVIIKRGYEESGIGSETFKEVEKIYRKLKYGEWCKENGIKLNEMTEDDYIEFYENQEFQKASESDYDPDFFNDSPIDFYWEPSDDWSEEND